MLKHETAGDPISGLKWTHKTVRKIADELKTIGIEVGKDTVAKLLKESGYALRVNHKKLSGGKYSSPEAQKKRNAQFEYIKVLVEKFAQEGEPIISVDTKKKEMVGFFKNNGETWEKLPVAVNDHDFCSLAIGKGIPYGIYDIQGNTGSVFIGTTHDTPAFAVDSIVQWWTPQRCKYPGAKKILILADSGGSNGYRSRVWKHDLYRKLARRYGIEVTVAHYPPGTSKWNPIEHRLFSEISKNWKGIPLCDYETMLKYIRTTKTSSGLKVRSYLNKRKYKNGQKVSDEEMGKVPITKHETNPELNYTLNAKSVRRKIQKEEKNRRIYRRKVEKLIKMLENSRKAIDSIKPVIEALFAPKM